MADPARRRRHGEIQRAIFQVLLDQPDGLAAGEVLSRAEEILPPTPFEDQDYERHPGVRRYPKKMRFDSIKLVKAGWLIKHEGVWRLTESGHQAYRQFADAEDFEKESRRQYRLWKAQQPSDQFDDSQEAEDVEAAQLESGEQRRRAWLVRGANVDGENVLPRWLSEGFCSVGWSELEDIPAGTPNAQIGQIVQSGFVDATFGSRRATVGNLNRFLNQISIHDVVVTVDGPNVYVGEITGDPTFTGEEFTTRQRAVDWNNTDAPIKRNELSPAAADGLRSRLTVSELTPHLAEFAALSDLDDVVDVSTPDVHLNAPSHALADELLLPLEWLAETIELLNEKRQIVLYGPPGTGKTYLALELCKGLVETAGGEYEVVQFHPSYAYEDFFEGLRPRLDSDGSGSIAFDLVPGPLRRMAKQAQENPGAPFVLIIDEINRANLAKVFGELYFLLEYRERSIALQYSEEPFSLPRNLFIIGTMNTADRSIALVDAAMRRRFYFQKMFPTEQPIKGMLEKWLAREDLPNETALLLTSLNDAIGDPDFAIGPSYLMTRRVADEVGLQRIWRTAILPLLEEHFFGEGRSVEAEFGLAALRKKTVAPSYGEETRAIGRGDAPAGPEK